MIIKSTSYIGSFNKAESLPKGEKKEFAFIGRSNVGKSSLINMLMMRKDLARVSKSPGKTQSLNYYLINDKWYIVDCPGYGYAKISLKMRDDWDRLIKGYLKKRKQLWTAFVLIDSRIAPQKNDLEFIDWLGENEVPFSIVYTKADKQSKLQTHRHIKAFEKEMLKSWRFLPQKFVTSADERTGKDELLKYIQDGINTKVELEEEEGE